MRNIGIFTLLFAYLLISIIPARAQNIVNLQDSQAATQQLSYRSLMMGHPNFSSIVLPPSYLPGYSISLRKQEDVLRIPNIQKELEKKLQDSFSKENPRENLIQKKDPQLPLDPDEESFFFHGFKGNNEHTGYIDKETNKKISMLWRYSFYGDYITDIQVTDNTLFFADHSGYIHSIQAKDATLNWKYPLQKKRYVVGIDIGETRMYVTYGPIFSRRGIEDDSSLLYAVDLKTGKELWNRRLEQDLMVSPPLVEGDIVYVSTGKMNTNFSKTDGGKILGFDSVGEIIYSFSIEEFSFYGTYLTKSGSILIGAAYKFDRATRTIIPPQLYAFDLEKGRQIWTVKPIDENGFLGTPSIQGGYIYVTENPFQMGRGGRAPSNTCWLQKIELTTGKLEKSMPFPDENFGSFAPTLAKDALYLCSFTGQIYCINYDLERIWWQKRYNRFSYFTELLATKNYLYTILYEGEFLCINKTDGSVAFRYATGNYGRMPVVNGDSVYVSGNSLYCFSESAPPILFVEPSTLILPTVPQGEILHRSFMVVWTGTDLLQGQATASDSWITITPSAITQNIQTCFITLDTSTLPSGMNQAQIILSTNKGEKTLQIELGVLVPEPLSLKVNIPSEGLVTNAPDFTIEGETEPFAHVYINDYEMIAYPNGYFYDQIRLIEGNNPITIKAIAKDKRVAYFTGSIIKDSIPPVLSVNLPTRFETATQEFQITGYIEPGSILKIGTQEVPYEKDGSFSVFYTLKQDTETLRIRATDQADNTTQIKIEVLLINP